MKWLLALEGVKYNFKFPSCQWEPQSKKVCRTACPPVSSLPTEKTNSAFTITRKCVFNLFLNLCTAGDATGTTGSPRPRYYLSVLFLAVQGDCSLCPAQERTDRCFPQFCLLHSSLSPNAISFQQSPHRCIPSSWTLKKMTCDLSCCSPWIPSGWSILQWL